MLMKCLNLHWNNRLANKELYGHVDKLTNQVHEALTTGSLVTGHWSLVTGHWSLVTGPWSLVTGPWSLVTGPWSLVTGYWSLVPGYWLLVTGHWSLVTGHWSLVTGHWLLVPGPWLLVTGVSIQKDVCHCPSVDISDKMNREKQKKTCTERICENLDIKLRDPSLHEQPSHIETTHPGSGVMMIMMMVMMVM